MNTVKHIGHKIIRLENVESTNVYAEGFITENEVTHGTIILAKSQTKGKGYSQNRWFSGNNNLTFSIILQPKFVVPEKQFVLHKINSLSLIKTLEKYIPQLEFLKIKWPNDIYYKKYKLAGILTENKISGNQITHSIIGIGININQENFPKEIPNPISLLQIINKQTSSEEFLLEFCINLNKKYEQIKTDIDCFNEAYLKYLFQKGEYNKYFANNEEFEGKIIGIDEFGFLKLKTTENKTHYFDFKDIKYILK